MKLAERCLRLSLRALENPRRALLLWAAVTLLPLPGLLFLRVDTDGRALVPRRDPAVLSDAEIRERFHLRDLLVVHVRTSHPDGIFNPGTLRTVRAISERLRGMNVMSLATEKRDRLLPGSSSSFVSFLEPLPVSAQDMDWLRSDLASPAAKVYEGVLVSRDRRSLAILVDVPAEGIDRRALYRSIRKTLGGEDRISLVGAPAAEALLGDHILRDLALMIPLSVLLIGVVLWIGTRRVACVAIALGKAGICIVWTFAVLACFGIPVYLTTAVLPVVLATMAMSDEIHLLTRFQRESAERTLRDLVTPVVLATTTTGIGFLSFVSSPIAPVRAFGLGAALGIAWCLGFSLVVTPALMAILPESWLRRNGGERTGFRLAAIWHPSWTLAAIAAVTLAMGAGLSRLTVHDSWIESFAEGSEFRRQTAEVNRSLNGTHLLHVHLPFGSEVTDPEILGRLGELEVFLKGQPQVGGVLGLHSQLTALSHFWLPGVDPREILSRPREVRRLLNRYELSPGLLRRRQVVTDDFDETVVTVFLREANYRDTRTLMSRVETWHRERLKPLGAGLGWAGDVAVSQATIPAIVRTQTLSLPIALLGVFLVTAALYGSARLALAALFPVTLSAVWLLGALGWLGIPLGVATSMFFAIALGLGVDSQSIHFLDGWRRLGDVRRTVEEVGPAIALNTAAVAAGFGLLAVSSVPANARLGLLIALALALGGILTLSGLGSLLELGRVSPSSGKEGVMIRRTLVLLLLALILAACPAEPPDDAETPAPAADASPAASASPAPADAPIGQEPKSSCQQKVEQVQAQMRSAPPPRSFGFPHTPEMEFENSLISFRVCKVKKNLTPEQERRRLRSKKCCDPEFYDVELVKLDAYMRLCREEPVINELGFREMRFTIEKWELFGRSNLYDADIVFSATPGVVQPKSLAFAPKMAVPRECLGAGAFTPKCRKLLDNVTELSRSDFPALIVYNAIYDVYVNDKKIVSQEPGVAMARGAMQIPPTGITVAFQKPIDIPGVIKICPGTCAGMVTIPESTFNAGLDTARRIKAGQMRLDRGFVPQAAQRQPTIPREEGTPQP